MVEKKVEGSFVEFGASDAEMTGDSRVIFLELGPTFAGGDIALVLF